MLHKHGSDVTLIEDVATLAHVVKLHEHGSDVKLIEDVPTFADTSSYSFSYLYTRWCLSVF